MWVWYYLDTYTDTHTQVYTHRHIHTPRSTARNILMLFIGILLFWRQKVRKIGKNYRRTNSKIYNWIHAYYNRYIARFPFSCVIPALFCRVRILEGGYWRLRRTRFSLTCRKTTLECLFRFENINIKEILLMSGRCGIWWWLCAKKPGKIISKWIILCYLFLLCFHVYAPYQQQA